MNLRISVAAAVAVLLASLSLNAVLQGNGWLAAGIGAVAVIAAAGIATRLSTLSAAVTSTCVVLIGVVPLLTSPTWVLRGTGLAIVALTAASLTGWRALRGFAALACYLAALLVYLNLVFASAASFARIIPTSHSVATLGRMVPVAFDQFNFSPPVPDTRQVSLVAAAGIGLIAIIVDILAARLRRPAVAGVPLLVLFSVPIASNLKTFGVVQSVTFAAALAGFLALLSADGRMRLRMWGRLVTFRYVQPADEAGEGPDTKELAASGRRIGLAAVCLAVIIPAILPAVHTHDVFGTTNNGKPHGVGGGLDAFIGVQHDLSEQHPEPVLSYTTNAGNAAQQYFQVFSLNYNASRNAWFPQFPLGVVGSRPILTAALPYGPEGQLATTPTRLVTTAVRIAPSQGGPTAYLPVPYAPVKLAIGGDGWEELAGSLMILSPVQGLSDLQYQVTSSEANPTPGRINNPNGEFVPVFIQNQYGSYGGPDQGRLLTIMRHHTQGAQTLLQSAIDLQNWLESSAFTYTLRPDLPTSHWLLRFLTTERRGYCQQFAWALAVLARLAGIPSRIAVGYTGGTPGLHGRWQVTTADAHAWPELYFAGQGWLRFEPTPHGAADQGTATVPSYANARSTGPGNSLPGGSSQNRASSGGGAGTGKKASSLNRLTHGQPGVAGAAAGPSDIGRWLAIGIPVLIVLLLTWPVLIRLGTRRRRWLTAAGEVGIAHAAWRELTDDLADIGLPVAPGETTRAVAKRVAHQARLAGPAADALVRIATAEERARYARLAMPAAGLAADVRIVRRAVAASVSRGQRLRAWFLPASTLRGARRLLERVGSMLSWLDSSWPALRRQLRQTLTQRSA